VLGVLGLVTASSLLSRAPSTVPHPSQETPFREAAITSFGNEVGTVTFAEFLEGDLRVQGSVFIGPTVVLEHANSAHAAGDRVVPVAFTCTLLSHSKYVASWDGLYYRSVSSREPFTWSKSLDGLFCEVAVLPAGDLTWEQLDHENDLLVSITGKGRSSE